MNKLIAVLGIVLLVACQSGRQKTYTQPEENFQAKSSLQGIWLEDESETPLLRIQGDTIYYSDPKNIPVYFRIIEDTLHTYGYEQSSYQIDKQTEYEFWFHSYPDNIVKLYKSEEPNDSLFFSLDAKEITPIYTEKQKKDSVIFYNGTRYRAYVYINPSTIKVIKTAYSEEGINMENVYYDNIMHICVYEGRKSLFASDITKQMFEGVIPSDFLSQSILSDMDFIGINSKGYQYQAQLCIPESAVCNLANLTISFDGKLRITAVK